MLEVTSERFLGATCETTRTLSQHHHVTSATIDPLTPTIPHSPLSMAGRLWEELPLADCGRGRGGLFVFGANAVKTSASQQVAAVQAWVTRLLRPKFVDRFALELLSVGAQCYLPTLQQPMAVPTSVVKVSGSSGVELAAGVGYCLRHVANLSFSWRQHCSCGGTFCSAANASTVRGKRTRTRGTSAQTHTRSCGGRWQREIYLVALMDVDLPLADIGQEATLRQTLPPPEYNKSDDELAPFFTGCLTWYARVGGAARFVDGRPQAATDADPRCGERLWNTPCFPAVRAACNDWEISSCQHLTCCDDTEGMHQCHRNRACMGTQRRL